MAWPPENIVYFIDRSLGSKQLANALREAGATVIAHDDRFDRATPDSEWLQVVGREEWIVLTKDAMIRKRHIERNALISARVATFIFTKQQARGEELVTAFVKAMPRIERLIAATKPPFIAKVSISGKVQILERRNDLLIRNER